MCSSQKNWSCLQTYQHRTGPSWVPAPSFKLFSKASYDSLMRCLVLICTGRLMQQTHGSREEMPSTLPRIRGAGPPKASTYRKMISQFLATLVATTPRSRTKLQLQDRTGESAHLSCVFKCVDGVKQSQFWADKDRIGPRYPPAAGVKLWKLAPAFLLS